MPLSELFEIMWPLLERRARDAGVSEADIQEMYQVPCLSVLRHCVIVSCLGFKLNFKVLFEI